MSYKHPSATIQSRFPASFHVAAWGLIITLAVCWVRFVIVEATAALERDGDRQHRRK